MAEGGGSAGGIERVVRASSTHSFEFLINHSSHDAEVEIAPDGFDLLARSALARRLVLPPSGVAIVRRTERAPGG